MAQKCSVLSYSTQRNRSLIGCMYIGPSFYWRSTSGWNREGTNYRRGLENVGQGQGFTGSGGSFLFWIFLEQAS